VQATLEEKLKKSEELRTTFHHFLTEVAKAAENSKTGRPIPHKVLSDYTKQEGIKDAELQKVRLRHLMLKAQLAKIEHRVKQKVFPAELSSIWFWVLKPRCLLGHTLLLAQNCPGTRCVSHCSHAEYMHNTETAS